MDARASTRPLVVADAVVDPASRTFRSATSKRSVHTAPSSAKREAAIESSAVTWRVDG
jgi:hypothetical protein